MRNVKQQCSQAKYISHVPKIKQKDSGPLSKVKPTNFNNQVWKVEKLE